MLVGFGVLVTVAEGSGDGEEVGGIEGVGVISAGEGAHAESRNTLTIRIVFESLIWTYPQSAE